MKLMTRLARGKKGIEAIQAIVMVAVCLMVGYGIYKGVWKGGVENQVKIQVNKYFSVWNTGGDQE